MLPLGCDPPAIEPDVGRASGGQILRIAGHDFASHGGVVVYVGPRAAKAVVVESDELITAMTPEADAPGVVDIELRFGDGTIVAYPQAFRYDDRAVIVRSK